MRGLVMTLGDRDRLADDGVARVAERAGVAAEAVVCVARLCERALKPDGSSLAEVFAGDDEFVVGCSRPRAARALLDFAGVAHREKRIAWLALPYDREALKAEYGVPWYPVIDRTRCTGCGTCASYCLFSVYDRSESAAASQRVRVVQPLNCKTGCPACARLCPESAVIFPFCEEDELNGQRENPDRRTPETLAALLGDDPLRVLAERRKRKQLIDPSKFQQAEEDRVRYSGVL